MDSGIIQLIIGGIMLYIAFGIIKEMTKIAFYVVLIIAVLIMLSGTVNFMGEFLAFAVCRLPFTGYSLI